MFFGLSRRVLVSILSALVGIIGVPVLSPVVVAGAAGTRGSAGVTAESASIWKESPNGSTAVAHLTVGGEAKLGLFSGG